VDERRPGFFELNLVAHNGERFCQPTCLTHVSITAPPLLRETPRIGPLEGACSEHLGDRRGKGQVPSPLEGQTDTTTPAGSRERRAAMGRRASSAGQ
jgi:hypothetical protein